MYFERIDLLLRVIERASQFGPQFSKVVAEAQAELNEMVEPEPKTTPKKPTPEPKPVVLRAPEGARRGDDNHSPRRT